VRSFVRRAPATGVALVAALLVGCGGARPLHVSAATTDREWVANAAGVIDQLNTDVAAVTPAGADLATARRSLHDLSDLYGLLVAYTDFGGCNKMVSGTGNAPPGFARVVDALARACSGFERGAALFTRAAGGSGDPRALVAASKHVKMAAALLYRATLALAAARSAPTR
jgi:hypothetical protein